MAAILHRTACASVDTDLTVSTLRRRERSLRSFAPLLASSMRSNGESSPGRSLFDERMDTPLVWWLLEREEPSEASREEPCIPRNWRGSALLLVRSADVERHLRARRSDEARLQGHRA
jgi:hypothetical protein